MCTLSKPVGLILVLLGACLFRQPAQAKYAGGTGEPNDPYQIATAADLIALGETPGDYDKHFILTADIDLDPNLPGRKVFDKAVIAPTTLVYSHRQGTAFRCLFDGNDHTISHLTISGRDSLGLFGLLGKGALVRRLGVVDVNINGSSSGDQVGGLVGQNDGVVSQCYSTGVVGGHAWMVGGLVGCNKGTLIQSYSASMVITTGDAVGGLVGTNEAGAVIQCYSTGEVIGDSWVGGLAGRNYGTPNLITHCYSTGPVSGSEDIGGLVGSGEPNLVAASFWDTQTSGQTTSAGGTGKTTAEMLTTRTFLEAGWDFTNEIENGTSQVWQMPEDGGYPVLAILNGSSPPELQGMGTPEDPFLISNALELGAMVHYSSYAHYRLEASIDLSGIHWGLPVIPWFAGTFDGNDHTISYLTVTGGGCLAMFGQLGSRAQVMNLGLVDVNIASADDYVGGLVAINSGTVFRCFSTGSVNGTDRVGGLVGVSAGDVTECHSTGSVSGRESVGGLVGSNGMSSWQASGPITGCYSTATVRGTSYYVGGLVGCTNSTVTDSYSAGAVSGHQFVGGLLGSGDATRCYSASAVSGRWDVGGLVGNGGATHCYSTGTVSGSGRYVGGLVGRNVGAVVHCYSTAVVNGDAWVGGLVGRDDFVSLNTRFVVASLWDIQTSGQLKSDGGTGKTTAQMQMASTFLGWGSCGPIWTIDEGRGYPHLIWEGVPGEIIDGPTYGGGVGTEQDPYLIYTAEQLNTIGFAPCDWGKHFKQMADIDLSGLDGKNARPAFNIIGSGSLGQSTDGPYLAGIPFTGVFDGNGHWITNFTFSADTDSGYIGLFGYVDDPNAQIKDLRLIDPNVRAPGGRVGCLTGCLNGGSITRCSVENAKVEGAQAGGLVGNNGGGVAQCYSTGTVIGRYAAGGLIGSNAAAPPYQGTVEDCYSTSFVTGAGAVGGLIGRHSGEGGGAVTRCYCTGAVSGNGENVGGLVGPYGDYITDCFWDTQTSGLTTSACGTGKTTAEMQTAKTFLEAGWDFVGETTNGTEDIWWIDEGKDYPRLWWEPIPAN